MDRIMTDDDHRRLTSEIRAFVQEASEAVGRAVNFISVSRRDLKTKREVADGAFFAANTFFDVLYTNYSYLCSEFSRIQSEFGLQSISVLSDFADVEAKLEQVHLKAVYEWEENQRLKKKVLRDVANWKECSEMTVSISVIVMMVTRALREFHESMVRLLELKLTVAEMGDESGIYRNWIDDIDHSIISLEGKREELLQLKIEATQNNYETSKRNKLLQDRFDSLHIKLSDMDDFGKAKEAPLPPPSTDIHVGTQPLPSPVTSPVTTTRRTTVTSPHPSSVTVTSPHPSSVTVTSPHQSSVTSPRRSPRRLNGRSPVQTRRFINRDSYIAAGASFIVVDVATVCSLVLIDWHGKSKIYVICAILLVVASAVLGISSSMMMYLAFKSNPSSYKAMPRLLNTALKSVGFVVALGFVLAILSILQV